MLRIHHLNCVSMCPFGGHMMDGRTRSLGHAELVCHCLLLETDRDGLVLVDTGFGTRDVQTPHNRLSEMFLRLLQPALRDDHQTARTQLQKLGFRAEDVRHIVLTHLDFDHAGGLDDFPRARVHLLERERANAASQRSWLDRQRYRPQQWGSRERWATYEPQGEPWFGFASVRSLQGLSENVLLIPLAEHTLGHAGVAVERAGGGFLLHCGDAYFHHLEIQAQRRRCPTGLRAYQTLMEQDRRARLANQWRLRTLAREHSADVQLFCAHDCEELERLQRASARELVEAQRARESRPGALTTKD